MTGRQLAAAPCLVVLGALAAVIGYLANPLPYLRFRRVRAEIEATTSARMATLRALICDARPERVEGQ